MAGADVVQIKDANFKAEVLDSQTPVLVDFWATWCAPCRAIAPSIEEFASTHKGKLKVAKVNIDDNQDVAQQFGIRSIPTVLFFKGGRVVEQIVGSSPNYKSKLEDVARKIL